MGSFKETKPPGLLTLPSCDLLIQDLRLRNAMIIPKNKQELSWRMSEIIEEVFKFAPRISVMWTGSRVSITFHKYPYIEGCKILALKSPQCCTMSACPACSLCGLLIAEGLNKVVTLDRCSVISSSPDVTALFSIVPYVDGS